MKKLILATLLIFSNQFTYATDFTEDDKKKHIFASAGIAVVSYSIYKRLEFSSWQATVMAFLTATAVGIVKEESDKFRDNEDMEANLIGTSAGLLVPVVFDF